MVGIRRYYHSTRREASHSRLQQSKSPSWEEIYRIQQQSGGNIRQFTSPSGFLWCFRACGPGPWLNTLKLGCSARFPSNSADATSFVRGMSLLAQTSPYRTYGSFLICLIDAQTNEYAAWWTTLPESKWLSSMSYSNIVLRIYVISSPRRWNA